MLGASAAGCASGRNGPPPDTKAPEGPHTLKKLSVAERQQVMERAQVWRPMNTSSLDLIEGPVLPASQRIPEQVACTFVFPDKPLGGMTPKFKCDLGKGDEVKVKYGEKNGEVYAEVAATRLFWALGFGADRMYPVQVTCRNCPIEPWYWATEKRVPEKTFEIAAIERRLPGKRIQTKEDEGWKWPELDTVDEKAGGAPRAHRDALKLLMVMIQNSDTKPSNQRMLCLPEAVKADGAGNETCARPLLYVQDLGYAFGEATLLSTKKNDLQAWSEEPIWKDPAQCVGNIKKSLPGTFKDPVISEAGRKFLDDLLARLSDKQITDMFTAARVDRFHRHAERNPPISEWVRVFKKKRDEIATARCPS